MYAILTTWFTELPYATCPLNIFFLASIPLLLYKFVYCNKCLETLYSTKSFLYIGE